MSASKSSDVFWMQHALDLALRAKEQNEVPVGAIIVDEHHTIIGQGYNQVIQNNDPTAHAELIAIREATRQQHNYRLHNATLYVTLEPCCMCAGAIVHARIKRLVFGTRDIQSGAAGSAYQLLGRERLNHHVQVDDGFLQKECSHLLVDFFNSKRNH